ncbi:MAG: hypothetical protein VW373_06965 [Halieaceae bacterium]
MKQFQKIGVAAAVASVAAGAVAQQVSRTETGDLAIVPYYTVKDGVNTGLHIINTTDSTQVVKVRLRRGTDSKDALDFNVVMSPRDEWTANIGAGGDTGVHVTTNDTTCTVPAFTDGVAQMPGTFSEGAEEGYVEIIAMAQADDAQGISISAKHVDGVPRDCDNVRQHFYRVPAASVGDSGVRGVHTSALASDAGACTAGAATTAVCATTAGAAITGAANLSEFTDSDDNALKVSFMLTDPDGGLEAGDNAVMVEGFSSAPMLTNQQPLSFGTDGLLNYDPLNFELPNLAYGAYESNITATSSQIRNTQMDASLRDGSMWSSLADALDADSIMNDWAAFDTADASVNADWVVTLPGQYVMTNPICDIYTTYGQANATAAAACAATSSTAASGTALADAAQAYSAAGGADRNQLPLLVASNVDGVALIGDGTTSNFALWDREEDSLLGEETDSEDPDPELGFSPGGSVGDPADPDITVILPNEVNVIDFGEPDAPSALVSDLKLTVTPTGADRGWARLDIQPVNTAPERWSIGGIQDDANIVVAGPEAGTFTAVADATDVPVVGFAVWQRSFAAQAGNYGRMVEHSTITSTSTTR